MVTESSSKPSPGDDRQGPGQKTKQGSRPLTPEAQRALAEAEARRKARAGTQADAPGEIGGRDGPDPVRHGDWEKDGIASDF